MPTILLVDDNHAVTEIIRALLLRNNYGVQVANSPLAAEELLKREHVDVVVSDVMMPQVDGFELGRRIRANPQTANLPIIYLTALDSIEDEFEAWMSGADAYMVKPFKARDLLNSIDGVLAGKRRMQPTSDGRLNITADSPRALVAATPANAARLVAAAKEAGMRADVCADIDSALKRLDRERFALFVCDASLSRFSVQAVSDYLRYFALNIPVVLLGVSEPLEPRFLALPANADVAAVAAALRDCLQRSR